MTRPAALSFSGRAKWGDVAVDLALVAGGAILVAVAAPELSGREPVGLWLLVLYTVFAVAVTLVRAGTVALTTRLPVLEESVVDGRTAMGVRSWGAPWWHTNALDLGLAMTGLALGAVGLLAGGEWAVVGAAPGLVGLWFLVRVALGLLGRRRRPAVWLTSDEVVLDSPAGRARADHDAVRRVRGRGRRLVIELESDATWSLCPRPWRRAVVARDTLVLDCTDVGHRAADLAAWLTEELAAARPAASTSRGRGTTPPAPSTERPEERLLP